MASESKKRHILEWLSPQYRKAKKGEKAQIIEQAMAQGGWSRKHATKLLREGLKRGRPKVGKKRGRPSKYSDYQFKQSLKRVWKCTDYLCGRYLKEAMGVWLPSIEKHYGAFPLDIRERLLAISASTIDRLLAEYKVEEGQSLTRNAGFRDEIPIQTNIWDIQLPGFIETDTVAHCGTSMAGEFANSLTVVDINTLWTEARMVWGRGSQHTFNALMDVERRLPFEILGYDADNGGEVLNRRIFEYFTKERINQGRKPAQVTRSREYRKNDNAHVEQRNNSVVRKTFGYGRYDFQQLIPLMNYYYVAVINPLQNHFLPSLKLRDKQRVGSRTRRVYEKPATPYSRVIASPHVTERNKNILSRYHESLDPIALKKHGEQIQKQIRAAQALLKQGKDPGALLTPPPLPKALFFHHGNLVTRTRISYDHYATKKSESAKFGEHEL